MGKLECLDLCFSLSEEKKRMKTFALADMKSRSCVDFLLVFIFFSLINESQTEQIRLRGVQTSRK